jgi:hypothetical protein
MVIKLTDIQGLYVINPKTKEYLIRIGHLLFPFKNANEVFAYFLGLSKMKKEFKKQKMSNEAPLSLKCLFFKNDSCLSNCQVVFSIKPNYTTPPFNKNSFFTFGEGFNE